jgi:thiol-disulfide isomerase/thioredoxin
MRGLILAALLCIVNNLLKAQSPLAKVQPSITIEKEDSTLIQTYDSEGSCFNARVTRCSFENLKLKIAFTGSQNSGKFYMMHIFLDSTNCGLVTQDKKNTSMIKESLILRVGLNQYYQITTKKVDSFFKCAIVPATKQKVDCIIGEETDMNVNFATFKSDSVSLAQIMADSKKKYAYLNFWTSYCPPCIEHIPDYNTIAESENILLININCNNGWDSAAISQIKKYNFKGIHLKSNELIQKECNQNGYSYGAMIDKKGNIIHQGIRYNSKEVILFNKQRKKVR